MNKSINSNILVYLFISLTFFDFLTKDIFTNYLLPLDGVKVQLYKVYLSMIFLLAILFILSNWKVFVITIKVSFINLLMSFWFLIGFINLFLLPIISNKQVTTPLYIFGDFIGWQIIPVLYFSFLYKFHTEGINITLNILLNSMRVLIVIGVLKFLVLKLLNVNIIPMGFPIFMIYVVCIYSVIIGFNNDFTSKYFSPVETKLAPLIFMLIIALMLIYAQRTQLVIIIFLILFMFLFYGKWGGNKIIKLTLTALLLLTLLNYIPETILLKFSKIFTGLGTSLPDGTIIPYLTLDNSLTQRLYEAFDVIKNIHNSDAWLFGYGNGSSFISYFMRSFKEEELIHHIHISYIAVLFRMGGMGLILILLLVIYSLIKSIIGSKNIKIFSLSFLCIAIDIFFFQKLYYSIEIPLILSMMVYIKDKHDTNFN